MSVVGQEVTSEQKIIYCKGSPEKIESLCVRQTIPADFQSVLQTYTNQGFRVIALAYKEMGSGQVNDLTREQCESSLQFLGLLIMQNKLKEQTTAVIKELNKCEVRTIMATGDNLLTALSVARQCELIETTDKTWLGQIQSENESSRLCWTLSSNSNERIHELPFKFDDEHTEVAMTGDALELAMKSDDQKLIVSILKKARVFARMTPDQKALLVESI
jgi:cation-transporting ATPase 13A3/4/5